MAADFEQKGTEEKEISENGMQLTAKWTNSKLEDIVSIEQFKDESQLESIMRIIADELSEPYSIYTYRYFIHNWPNLCFLVRDLETSTYIGTVICKIDKDPNGISSGYIAMLAIDVCWRRKGLGSRVVELAIRKMVAEGCDEIVLETEVTNKNALNLYSKFGFIREKRLYKYYLNGGDAFRLKYFIDKDHKSSMGKNELQSLAKNED